MPYILVFRRYAPFSTFGFGFEGDGRSGPSTSLSDTARTTGIVFFDATGVGSVTGSSSGTTFQGLGTWLAAALGKHYSSVRSTVSGARTSPGLVQFTASTEGANPMVPGAPDIDTYIDFSARWFGGKILFDGTLRGDNFPNAEVFVLDGAKNAVLLFNGVTSGGRQTGPMTRLAGSGAGKTIGRFSVAAPIDPRGSFLPAPLPAAVTMA
jgi:hypothetical protein